MAMHGVLMKSWTYHKLMRLAFRGTLVCLVLLDIFLHRSVYERKRTLSVSDDRQSSPNRISSNSALSHPNSSLPTDADKGLFTNVKVDPRSHRRDPICGGCRHAVVWKQSNKGITTCGLLMAKLVSDTKISVLDAADRVGTDYPENCARCRRGVCAEGGMYYRYDDVAPRIERSMTHSLVSIPSEHRLPALAFRDLDEYLSHDENTGQHRDYLFEYNPSIMRLPQDKIPVIPGEDPVYLASYRVAGRNSCLSGPQLQNIWPEIIEDMVGLALLRTDLSIIVDVVVDLTQIGMRIEDARLFALNDTVYLTSMTYVIPLQIYYNETVAHALAPRFPSLLSVVMTNQTVTCITRAGYPYSAKNLNYFHDELNQTMVEIWPSSPHQVHPVNLTSTSKFCADAPSFTISDSANVLPSFFTVEELHYPVMRRNQELFALRDRGTACCVDMEHPESGEKLLLGVSHTKTPWRQRQRFPANELPSNQFVSRFYAFKPNAPYRVVARSGFFCLGSGTETELADHPVADYNRKIRHLWIGEKFDCPAIHFVSGMTEKADDRSRVILAYGINDCSSRFVEVDKEEILRLLFYPNTNSTKRLR